MHLDVPSISFVSDVLYAVLYVRVHCFVVHGCAASRRYINVYNNEVLCCVYSWAKVCLL